MLAARSTGCALVARQHAAPGAVRLFPGKRTVQQQRCAPARAGQEPEASTSKSAEEMPIWVRREKEREMQAGQPKDAPWGLYLIGSVLVAIAATGSIFEYFNRHAIFEVVQPDSPLWAPILGMFALTGFPTAGVLFFRGVKGFNDAAERQDRLDGYIE